jgi:hypothetical protein
MDFGPPSWVDEPFKYHTACSTKLSIAISFGGPSWPISLDDLNLGTISNGQCLGAIFDITQGSNVTPGQGNPSWIIGDTFLVRFLLIQLGHFRTLTVFLNVEKRI